METKPDDDIRRLYGDLAWTWPILSPPADYIDETGEFVRLINRFCRMPARSVLNLGCGGGHNDYTLKRSFDVTGVDISAEMLALARQLNPEVRYLAGDMRTLRMDQLFDAVTIFDSINYMCTPESLKSALLTAFTHVKPGGVFLTYIEEWREKFIQNKTHCYTRCRDEVEITFVENYYDPDLEDNSYEGNFIFLIRRSGRLTVEHDCHRLGLFELELWPQLMRQVGFEVHREESGVPDRDGNPLPILIGSKPI